MTKPQYTVEEAVDFSLLNERDTLADEKFAGDIHCESIKRFLDNLTYYADTYGYTVQEFKAEVARQGIKY